MMNKIHPTPYPEVNALLQELLEGVRAVLGKRLIGVYLDGSLAGGDFDRDSDIDFVAVSEEEVSGDLFSELRAMHERIAKIDSPYAIQLEGSYISRRALRRFDPANSLHPNIERGEGERLKMVRHDEDWAVHRYILRERGITLVGPVPQTLIDPVSPDDLRRAMLVALRGWARQILEDPARINGRGYQSYIVLSLCRILYTLEHGAVVSKQVAARWAREASDERWTPLIERALTGRLHPESEMPPEDVNGTLALIRHALEHSRQFEKLDTQI